MFLQNVYPSKQDIYIQKTNPLYCFFPQKCSISEHFYNKWQKLYNKYMWEILPCRNSSEKQAAYAMMATCGLTAFGKVIFVLFDVNLWNRIIVPILITTFINLIICNKNYSFWFQPMGTFISFILCISNPISSLACVVVSNDTKNLSQILQ